MKGEIISVQWACYRVWFTDGTAILVDATNSEEAKTKAKATATQCWEIEEIEKL